MNRCDALRRVLFLRGISDDALSALTAAGGERRLAPGETLFLEGDRCLGLVVVLRGAVKVFKVDARGREVTLGVERPGGSVGDLALFDGGNYPAGAQAVLDEPSTAVFIVPRQRFEALMAAHPEIAAGAVRALAVQSRKLIEMLKAQALHTVRARIAAYLLHAAGESDCFRLPETNAGIGGHVGTVREVVSRTLHALEDAGAIRLRGRAVTLLDRDLLRRIGQTTLCE
jgi:CRP/FNR family transcriptional regulator